MAKTAENLEARGPSPKQLGKQLRQVRRKQGLSRGDVARSAGLTRRELAAYERGRVNVPDSDLWCLAGSCGVDVTELLPEREPLKVGTDLSSLAVGESIRYLRGPSEPDGLLHEYLSMIYELRNLPAGSRIPLREPDLIALAEALGGSPETIERRLRDLIGATDEEAARLRAMILPSISLPAPSPVEQDPIADFTARGEAANEFFSMPRASDPFQPPPSPEVPSNEPSMPPASDLYAALAADTSAPVDLAAPGTHPLDVGAAPEDRPVDADPFGAAPVPADPFTAAEVTAPAWTEPNAEAAPQADPFAALRDDPFAPSSEPLDIVPSDVSVPTSAEVPLQAVAPLEPMPAPEAADPLPTWQTPASPLVPEPLVAQIPEAPAYEPVEHIDLTASEPQPMPMSEPEADWYVPAEGAPAEGAPSEDATVFEPFVVDVPDLVEHTPSPLAYRAPDSGGEINWAPDAPTLAYASQSVAYAPDPVPSYVPDHGMSAPAAAPAAHVPSGQYQQAGTQWEVGGIVQASTTADQGGLALRRADARWALADLVASGDFTLEVVFDFRSGAGFGILFRAAADDAERVTAYSFDIDTLAGEGCYLLRQWEVGHQHWQPLAQVPVSDASRLYGRHTITLSMYGDRLVVNVDGDAVIDIEALSRASLDHGRAPCRGDRAGVQAAATTEVTIESFRLAQH